MKAFARRLSQTFRPPRVRFDSRVSANSAAGESESRISDLSQAAHNLKNNSSILARPSVASIYQFDSDREYMERHQIGPSTTPNASIKSQPTSIDSYEENSDQQTQPGSILKNRKNEENDKHERENREMFARAMRFLSILYALCLVVIGGLFTWPTIDSKINVWRECFLLTISLLGIAWLGVLHFDILKYKRWALELIHPNSFDDKTSDVDSIGSFNDAYDSVSLNTAVIFDRVTETRRHNRPNDQDTISVISTHLSRKGEYGYRYFQGKHSNDFYLKCGVIVFCFGSVMHLGVGTIQEFYFLVKGEEFSECRNVAKLFSDCSRVLFSLYQLYIMFKYSNIIINRHKNFARFGLMHLLGSSIALWLTSILDEVIEEFVHTELHENGNNHTELNSSSSIFREHILHYEVCESQGLVSNDSISALPYLYPFTIEFNIAMASIWYMIWTNIGKVNDRSLFHPTAREVVEDSHGHEDVEYRSSGLSIQVDCHASSRGLFLGLGSLLAIIITIVVFFSTLSSNTILSVTLYSAQFGVLTMLGLIVIPLAYIKIQQLNVVSASHRDNAFTIMDDILVLFPLPFYLIHYSLSIVANFNVENEEYLIHSSHGDYRANAIVLSIIEVFTVLQVFIQSPFIVDGLRRCANSSHSRFNKPGRELVTFALILNVIFWILNTLELKSVEEYHGLHHYFGPIYSKMITHTTMPLMLFYRFHSSVCLSNIWKYAYEKDHH